MDLMPETSRGGRGRRAVSYGFVRCAVGGLLIVAALLKGYQLATEPVANENLLTYRWSMLLQAELELLLGLWLVAGLWRRLTWAATTACFVGFAWVTAYKAATGESSCGCFGPIEVNPWFTLILDVIVLAALIVLHPELWLRWSVRGAWGRVAGVAAVWVVVGLAIFVGSSRYRSATIDASGRIVGNAPFVVLRPSEWVDGRFPLLDHIDIGEKIIDGDWLVILLHDQCRECRDALPRYRRLAEEGARKGRASVAIIEFPPFVEPDTSFFAGLDVVRGRISTEREWFLRTPREVLLIDGMVRSVDEQDELPAATARGPAKPITITHHAGKVRLGATVSHTFTITNTTARTWTAAGVLTDCACAEAPDTLAPIAPGESWEFPLKVIADAPGEQFAARAYIQLLEGPPIQVVVAADSIEQVPPSVVFGNVKRGEQKPRQIAIRSVTDEPISVLEAVYDEALLDVQWRRDTDHPNDVVMDVAIRDDVPSERLTTRLVIHTDDGEVPVHSVVVEANILALVTVSPDLLGFGRVLAGETRTTVLRILSPYGNKVALEGVDVSDDTIITCDAATATRRDDEIHLPVTLNGGFEQRYFHGTLTIRLLVDGQPYAVTVRVLAAGQVRQGR